MKITPSELDLCPQIRVMAYGPDSLVEVDVLAVSEIRRYLAEYPVTWVDVYGLGLR